MTWLKRLAVKATEGESIIGHRGIRFVGPIGWEEFDDRQTDDRQTTDDRQMTDR